MLTDSRFIYADLYLLKYLDNVVRTHQISKCCIKTNNKTTIPATIRWSRGCGFDLNNNKMFLRKWHSFCFKLAKTWLHLARKSPWHAFFSQPFLDLTRRSRVYNVHKTILLHSSALNCSACSLKNPIVFSSLYYIWPDLLFSFKMF